LVERTSVPRVFYSSPWWEEEQTRRRIREEKKENPAMTGLSIEKTQITGARFHQQACRESSAKHPRRKNMLRGIGEVSARKRADSVLIS
jgi:hypothetical protein